MADFVWEEYMVSNIKHFFSEIMLEKFGKNILQEDFIKADSRTIWYEGPDVMAIVSGFQIDTIQMILHQGEIWFEYKIWQSLLVHPKKVIRKKFYSSFSFFKPSPWLPRTICWLHWLLTGVLLSRSLHLDLCIPRAPSNFYIIVSSILNVSDTKLSASHWRFPQG